MGQSRGIGPLSEKRAENQSSNDFAIIDIRSCVVLHVLMIASTCLTELTRATFIAGNYNSVDNECVKDDSARCCLQTLRVIAVPRQQLDNVVQVKSYTHSLRNSLKLTPTKKPQQSRYSGKRDQRLSNRGGTKRRLIIGSYEATGVTKRYTFYRANGVTGPRSALTTDVGNTQLFSQGLD